MSFLFEEKLSDYQTRARKSFIQLNLNVSLETITILLSLACMLLGISIIYTGQN